MNLRKLFVLFALASLFATQQAVGGKFAHLDRIGPQTATPEWQRYKVEGEEFSVLLPGVPAMNTSWSMYTDGVRRGRRRILGVHSEGVVYAIFTYEKTGNKLEDLIRRFSDKNSVQTPELVTVGGVNGKSLKFENDHVIRSTNFFATDKNFYVFKAQGSKLGNPLIGIPKFLSSVKFGKTDGIKITDGPGEEPRSDPSATSTTVHISEVDVRPVVVTKPEPSYTDEARMARVTGTIILRCVFSSSGAVTNLTVNKGLPGGLNDQATRAARQIRFIPGIKDGRFVSVSMQIEYNFNLY